MVPLYGSWLTLYRRVRGGLTRHLACNAIVLSSIATVMASVYTLRKSTQPYRTIISKQLATQMDVHYRHFPNPSISSHLPELNSSIFFRSHLIFLPISLSLFFCLQRRLCKSKGPRVTSLTSFPIALHNDLRVSVATQVSRMTSETASAARRASYISQP